MSSARRSTTYRPTRARKQQLSSRRQAYERTLRVESSHIGYLIGPKGSVIKGLQQKHGIRSRINQEKCLYLLSGPQQNVLAAVQEIQQHIDWINNVTDKRKETMSPQEQREEDGWTSAGPRRRSKNQPRRMVEKTTATEHRSENSFAGLDSDSDEEIVEPRTGKYSGEVPAPAKVFKPTGQWAKGVSAEVKEGCDMKLSKGMLEQRLAVASRELANAEKNLETERNTMTNCSWADAADIEDAEEEVDYWKGEVADLERIISAY